MFLIVTYLGTSQEKNLETIEIKIISYNIHSGTDKNMAPTLFDTINFLKRAMQILYVCKKSMSHLKLDFKSAV